jgi:hypothetical protein
MILYLASDATFYGGLAMLGYNAAHMHASYIVESAEKDHIRVADRYSERLFKILRDSKLLFILILGAYILTQPLISVINFIFILGIGGAVLGAGGVTVALVAGLAGLGSAGTRLLKLLFDTTEIEKVENIEENIRKASKRIAEMSSKPLVELGKEARNQIEAPKTPEEKIEVKKRTRNETMQNLRTLMHLDENQSHSLLFLQMDPAEREERLQALGYTGSNSGEILNQIENTVGTNDNDKGKEEEEETDEDYEEMLANLKKEREKRNRNTDVDEKWF